MENLYRTGSQALIGRTAQLDQLNRYIQEVGEGKPRVWLLQGEAGIGKTRLLQEIEWVAEKKGLQVYKGRCLENLNLPYLPFMDSLFPRLEQGFDAPETLYEDDLTMIRRLRRGHFASAPPTPEQANQDKVRLFLSVSRAILNLARQSPTLFIVDDLHWADQLSLDLFAYLVFALADQISVPFLMLGTHRPVNPEHQLARLVNRFEREPPYRSQIVPGLNEAEVREFLKDLGIPRPSHQLISTIYDATRGLPLFIQEAVNHLMQKGALQERKGYLVTNRASMATIQLPKNIQSAFATRAKGINKSYRQNLSTAAVLGERFSIDQLEKISNVSVDLLFDTLEEGMRQGLIVEEEEYFQFSHALVRQAFYKALSAARRRRIHLKIAQTLEQIYAANLDDHLLEIVNHLIEAGGMVESAQLVEYARKAGHQAFSAFAWSDAARYYEAALDAAEATAMSPQDMAELHYLAGLSHYRNADVGPVLDHYDQAIDLYRASGCIQGLAQTLVEQTVTYFTLSSVPLGQLAELQPLQAVLEALGDQEPKLRGRIATVMSQSYRTARQSEAAKQMAENALEIALNIQDDSLCADALTSLGLAQYNSMDVQGAHNSLQTALVHANHTTDLILQSWPLGRLPLSLTLLGNLDEAEKSALESSNLTIKTQDWGENSLALSHLVSIAVAKGNFATAKQRAHETMLMVDRSRYPWSAHRALPALACTHALLGQVSEAEQALDTLVAPGRVFSSPGSVTPKFASVFRLLARLYAGQPLDVPVTGTAEPALSAASNDTYSLAPLCALIEIGDYTNTNSIMDMPYELLSKAYQGGVHFTTGWMFLIPRVLGIAEAYYHRWEQSTTCFLEAIASATRVGAKPELARSYLDYARMLTTQDQFHYQQESIDSAEQALAIFHELEMAPFIKCAASFIEELQSYPARSSTFTSIYEGRLSTSVTKLLQYEVQEYISFLR